MTVARKKPTKSKQFMDGHGATPPGKRPTAAQVAATRKVITIPVGKAKKTAKAGPPASIMDASREEIERLIDLERSLIELRSKVAKAIVSGGLQDPANQHLVQHRLGHVLHRVEVMENAGDLSKDKVEEHQRSWREWCEL